MVPTRQGLTAFENTHMQLLQYGNSFTAAAPTALPVVQGGVKAIVVSRQTEVNTLGHEKDKR